MVVKTRLSTAQPGWTYASGGEAKIYFNSSTMLQAVYMKRARRVKKHCLTFNVTKKNLYPIHSTEKLNMLFHCKIPNRKLLCKIT
jgi:hypothetical protein